MNEKTFAGFPPPTQNYTRVPNSLFESMHLIKTMAEMKVIMYILRHTWGFQEYGIAKSITTDEFMNGRKLKNGGRMDNGTGLSAPSVRSGLESAVKHGFIEVNTDESDKARIDKEYMLVMSEANSDSKELSPDGKNLSIGGKIVSTGEKESLHRSEKETLKTPTKEVVVVETETTAQENDVDEKAAAYPWTEKLHGRGNMSKLVALYNMDADWVERISKAAYGPGIKDPMRWAVKGMKDRYIIKDDTLGVDDSQRFIRGKYGAFFEKLDDDDSAPLPEPEISRSVVDAVDPSPAPQPDTPPDIARAWQTALHQLKSQYPGNVTKMLEDATFSQSGQGEYTLTFNSIEARDKLLRYERNIHNVIAGALEMKQADITLHLTTVEARAELQVLPKPERKEAS